MSIHLALVLLAGAGPSVPQKSFTPPPFVPDVKTPAPVEPKKAAPDRTQAGMRASPAAERAPIDVRRVSFDRPLLHDVDEQGQQWARGKSYKARFGTGVAEFLPYFGPDAARNYPLTLQFQGVLVGAEPLALVAAAQPTRDGATISFERGACVERYELGLEHVEQVFVFESLPSRDEIALTIGIQTVLAPGEDALGFTFSNELGHVRMTRAVAIDARGTRLELETTLGGDALTIRVPAEFVAQATLPLTIDPVFTTFALDATVGVPERSPDITFHEPTGTWVTCWQEPFSSTDNDVFVRTASDTGTITAVTTIDSTSSNWAEPRIAFNREQGTVLTVAQVGAAGSRTIRGRLWDPLSGTLDSQVTISGSETGDKFNPDVGGDPNGVGPTYFCVVYEREEASDSDIHARLASRFDGTPVGGTIFLANSATNTRRPAISNTNGALPMAEQEWIVAWEHASTSGDMDIVGGRIAWDGTLISTNITFANTPDDEFDPCVSPKIHSPGTAWYRYVAAWEQRDASGNSSLNAQLFADNSPHVGEQLRTYPLGTSISSLTIDTDGANFLIGLGRTTGVFPSFSYSVELNCVYLAGGMGVTETVFVSTPSGDEQRPRVWSKYSSTTGAQRFGVAFERADGTLEDVWNATYDVPLGGPITSYCDGTALLCPCANAGAAGHGCAHSAGPAGARLSWTGTSEIDHDTLVLQSSEMPATASCLFFQGALQQTTPPVFGDGLRCTLGTTIRLGTKTAVGGTASYPGPGDPLISVRGQIPPAGVTRFYQAWFRNAASFCTSSTFNLTQALKVVWVQ